MTSINRAEFIEIAGGVIVFVPGNWEFRVINDNGIVYELVAVINGKDISAYSYGQNVHHSYMFDGILFTVVGNIAEIAACDDIFLVLLFAIYFTSLLSPISSIRATYLAREINPLSNRLRALML